MLDYVVELATAADVLDRIIVLYNDLGRAEWPYTARLAQVQAKAYGVLYEERHRTQGGLFDLIRARGKFPSSKARLCTSALKREPSAKSITELVRELNLPQGQRARILYCLGLRAEESPGRAKLPTLLSNRASSGRREVMIWHPVLHWTEKEIWDQTGCRVRGTRDRDRAHSQTRAGHGRRGCRCSMSGFAGAGFRPSTHMGNMRSVSWCAGCKSPHINNGPSTPEGDPASGLASRAVTGKPSTKE